MTHDLYQRTFDVLRADTELRTPQFETLLSRESCSRRSRIPILSIAKPALLLLAAILVLQVGQRVVAVRPADEKPSILSWTAQTDFLLELPVSQLMHGVPQLGVPFVTERAPPPIPSTL